MGKLQINPVTILTLLLFTALYSYGSYWLISFTENVTYTIVFSLMALILYVNVLRFFIFELCSLSQSRISELFTYLVMYAITISVLVLPLFLEPIFVFESPVLRIIIITFAALLLAKYCAFMLLGPWHDIKMLLKHRLNFDHIEYTPLVSVMIPAWNEGVGLINTIDSVLQSTYRNVEIIVINDGSTDDSNQKMLQFLLQQRSGPNKDINIKYRYQENSGKGGALNHAIKIASGDILMSVDADCYVNKTAITEFVRVFKDESISAAVGNVKIGNRNNTVGIVQYLEFLFSFYFKRADALLGSIYIIGGAAGAFRRSVFEKIGGYSETNITEDIELTVRMQDAGMKIEYASEAVVYTEGASDLKSLKNQRLRWKRGRFQTFYQYMHMFFSTKKHHNKMLTWIVMPLAMIQELQLLLEIPFLIFLYIFSILNADFTSYMIGVLVVGLMFFVQFMFYDKSTRKWSFVALAPIGWLLFYLATYVEAWALVKSIKTFIFGQEITWQRWDRKGVGNELKVTE